MAVLYPNYDQCLANLTASVEWYFGVAPRHKTLPLCDSLLEGKQYKNVVILLLDGMGMAILENNLPETGFLRSHLVGEFSSVFPPTTVAATTTVQSGLFPSEHGWLGWDVYFPEEDKCVTVFRNTLTGTQISAAEYPVAQTHRPYETAVERIRAAGFAAYNVTPFDAPYPKDTEKIGQRIQQLCAEDGRKFLYAYWTEPDHIMHETGVDSVQTRQTIAGLEAWVQQLSSCLEDTLLLITADHGHMNSRGASLEAHPEIRECLLRGITIEPRAVAFYVREGMGETFVRRFRAAFGEKFRLYSRAETECSGLFGRGRDHPAFLGSVGDYLAVAIDDLSLYETEEETTRFIGVHAGLTADEMRIPLIAVTRERKK